MPPSSLSAVYLKACLSKYHLPVDLGVGPLHRPYQAHGGWVLLAGSDVIAWPDESQQHRPMGLRVTPAFCGSHDGRLPLRRAEP
jgi:hypothetical protein